MWIGPAAVALSAREMAFGRAEELSLPHPCDVGKHPALRSDKEAVTTLSGPHKRLV